MFPEWLEEIYFSLNCPRGSPVPLTCRIYLQRARRRLLEIPSTGQHSSPQQERPAAAETSPSGSLPPPTPSQCQGSPWEWTVTGTMRPGGQARQACLLDGKTANPFHWGTLKCLGRCTSSKKVHLKGKGNIPKARRLSFQYEKCQQSSFHSLLKIRIDFKQNGRSHTVTKRQDHYPTP